MGALLGADWDFGRRGFSEVSTIGLEVKREEMMVLGREFPSDTEGLWFVCERRALFVGRGRSAVSETLGRGRGACVLANGFFVLVGVTAHSRIIAQELTGGYEIEQNCLLQQRYSTRSHHRPFEGIFFVRSPRSNSWLAELWKITTTNFAFHKQLLTNSKIGP